MSQLSVSQMIRFKTMLTQKAEQILFTEGEKKRNFSGIILYTFIVRLQSHTGQQKLFQEDI